MGKLVYDYTSVGSMYLTRYDRVLVFGGVYYYVVDNMVYGFNGVVVYNGGV